MEGQKCIGCEGQAHFPTQGTEVYIVVCVLINHSLNISDVFYNSKLLIFLFMEGNIRILYILCTVAKTQNNSPLHENAIPLIPPLTLIFMQWPQYLYTDSLLSEIRHKYDCNIFGIGINTVFCV